MKKLSYNVIFCPETEGGFTVIAPSLPECITYGRNLQEAKKMAVDAIRCYIISLKKHKEPIPNDRESFFSSVDIKGISVYA